MTAPTPRSAAPGEVQRLQAINEAMRRLDEVGELPADEALAHLEEVHQVLAEALNPWAASQGHAGSENPQ